MKVVIVNDIEDLISAKLEIDKYLIESKQIESKLTLEEYLKIYVKLDITYLDHGKNIPFNIVKLDNEHIYLFIAEYDEKFISLMDSVNYDIYKFEEISVNDITNNNNELNDMELIIDGTQYYKIN